MAGLLLGVTACGGSEAKSAGGATVPVESTRATSPAPTPRAGAPRVLIIGTSLTAGLGLDPDSAYPAVLQRIADSSGVPARIVAAGLSGETSAGALRRADWLLRDPADVVVIETGANDGLRGLDVDTTAANLRALIAKVQAAQPAARILVAQMEAPRNLGAAYTRRFHALFGGVAREAGAGVIPFFLDGIAGVPALNQDDGIHPNEEGARRAAAAMWRSLRPLLVDRGGPVG
jgi:acyl-CoA thioesterase-1